MFHRLESMFIAYAFVFEGDAGFPTFPSAPLHPLAPNIAWGMRLPSNLPKIKILVPFPLGSAGRAASLRFILLRGGRHAARRSVFFVVIQFAVPRGRSQ